MRPLVTAALAALLSTACATTRPAQPPPPPPGGLAPAPVATAPSAAAASELSRLRAAPATTLPARNAEAFEKLARTWPTSAEAPEALDEAARAWMRAKQPARDGAGPRGGRHPALPPGGGGARLRPSPGRCHRRGAGRPVGVEEPGRRW